VLFEGVEVGGGLGAAVGANVEVAAGASVAGDGARVVGTGVSVGTAVAGRVVAGRAHPPSAVTTTIETIRSTLAFLTLFIADDLLQRFK
jgi:hypothetical protein